MQNVSFEVDDMAIGLDDDIWNLPCSELPETLDSGWKIEFDGDGILSSVVKECQHRLNVTGRPAISTGQVLRVSALPIAAASAMDRKLPDW